MASRSRYLGRWVYLSYSGIPEPLRAFVDSTSTEPGGYAFYNCLLESGERVSISVGAIDSIWVDPKPIMRSRGNVIMLPFKKKAAPK
jgi:hypothetical protein